MKDIIRTALNPELNMGTYLDKQIIKVFPFHENFFEVFGNVNSTIGKRVIASGNDRIIKNDEGYLVNSSSKADVEYNISKVSAFASFCNDLDVDFAYVNYPTKLKDTDEWTQIGYTNPCIHDASDVLRTLEDCHVDYLDMRSLILQRYPDFYSTFYKTDYHWNAEAGFYATQKIISFMNERYGYELDESFCKVMNMNLIFIRIVGWERPEDPRHWRMRD